MPLAQAPEDVVDVALTALVTDLSEQCKGLLEVAVCLVEARKLHLGLAEESKRMRLGGLVAEALRGCHRHSCDVGSIAPEPSPVQERLQGPREQPRVLVGSCRGGVAEAGEQHGIFTRQPRHRVIVVCEAFKGHP